MCISSCVLLGECSAAISRSLQASPAVTSRMLALHCVLPRCPPSNLASCSAGGRSLKEILWSFLWAHERYLIRCAFQILACCTRFCEWNVTGELLAHFKKGGFDIVWHDERAIQFHSSHWILSHLCKRNSAWMAHRKRQRRKGKKSMYSTFHSCYIPGGGSWKYKELASFPNLFKNSGIYSLKIIYHSLLLWVRGGKEMW